MTFGARPRLAYLLKHLSDSALGNNLGVSFTVQSGRSPGSARKPGAKEFRNLAPEWARQSSDVDVSATMFARRLSLRVPSRSVAPIFVQIKALSAHIERSSLRPSLWTSGRSRASSWPVV